MTDNEKDILALINEVTDSKYIGKLKVRNEDGFWILSLYFNQFEHPKIVITKQTDSYNDFKDYIKTEIKTRKLEMVGFWRLDKEPFLDETC